MKKRKFGLALSLVLAAGTILGACGASNDNKKENAGDTGKKDDETFTVAMITDIGGVDDKSFNQSAWEGIKEFGEENGLEQGTKGYDYLQSKSEADYKTNLNTAVKNDFDLIYGIGYALKESLEEIAEQRKDTHFAIVDELIEGKDNVVSINFKDHEGSFLVGVVAAMMTKTDKIGFVGGVEGEVINRFAGGFQAGVKAVNPDAELQIEFAGSFGDAGKGQSIAAAMYNSGVDIIFQAAGGTGNGVFTEAKNLKKKDPNKEVWVIGVDRDQAEEGNVEVDGETYNVTLTSNIKRIDIAVKDLAEKAKNSDYPGGEQLKYGLEENAVGLSSSQEHLPEDVLKAVEEWKEKILNGEVEVPEVPTKE